MAQGLWTEERQKDRKAKKEAKVAESERQNVMRTLMSTIGGREFVYNILEGCGVFYTEFYPNALAMAYDNGKRSVGFSFLKDINDKCPQYYVQMMREANERSAGRSDRERPAGTDGSTGTDDTGSEHPGGEDAGGADQDGRDSDDSTDPNAPDPYGYYKGRRADAS